MDFKLDEGRLLKLIGELAKSGMISTSEKNKLKGNLLILSYSTRHTKSYNKQFEISF